MKLVTWNVNSIRARQAFALDWLRRHEPDVVCLQETKVEDSGFPAEALAGIGYRAAIYGQKTYNWVAILTRTRDPEPVGIQRGFDDGDADTAARFMVATVGGLRIASVYVPNGQSVGSEKFHYKLAWLRRLRQWIEGPGKSGPPLVLCGDFNIAPDDRDVYDPVGWRDQVLCHPDERAALVRVMEVGFVDLFRTFNQEAGHYSWWDYRLLGFPKNRGLRIDHFLTAPEAAARATGVTIDRDARKVLKADGETLQPSDHAPVVAIFAT